MTRPDFIKISTVSAIAFGAVSSSLFSTAREKDFSPVKSTTVHSTEPAWPDRARLVLSISMQMEAGAQPASGAESPMPPIDPKYPDLPATKWYEYGFKEGLPRLLDMFDRRHLRWDHISIIASGTCSRSENIDNPLPR